MAIRNTYHLKFDYFFGIDLKRTRHIIKYFQTALYLFTTKSVPHSNESASVIKPQLFHRTLNIQCTKQCVHGYMIKGAQAYHCANFLFSIRGSDKTLVICWFKRICLSLFRNWFGPPIVCKLKQVKLRPVTLISK